MTTSYTGFEQSVITVEADESLSETGTAVKITDEGKAAKCEEGDAFCGVCVNLRNGFAGVALKGFVTMPLSGECLAGYRTLSAAAGGAVQQSESGREYLVLEAGADEIGFIL